MKKTTCNVVFAIAAFAATFVTVPPANAQSAHMRVDVPFAFLAGDNVMPAGRYTVVLTEGSRMMTLDGKNFVRLPVSAPGIRRAADRAENGALRFDRIAGVFVLKSVWNRRHVEGCTLYPSKTERRFARGNTESVTLAMAR